MKKIIFTALPFLLASGGIFYWYHDNYGTNDYYTKINQAGTRTHIGEGAGHKVYKYRYKLASFNACGEELDIDFNSRKDHPMKKDAYLIVHVNHKKGVMGWEEIAKSQLPKKAENHLN